jgi:ABC-2 type transport system permease protein
MTRLVSLPLLRRTWRAQRSRVLLVCVGLFAWAFLLPVVYATFGRQLASLLDTDIVPKPFLRLMGADPFSLTGAVALGWVHPIGLGLMVLFPMGLGATMIAGERQRGTLEVLLSRPISRRALYATHLVTLAGLAALAVAAAIAGTFVGSAAYGVAGDLDPANLAFLALNSWLFLVALASVSLAASASFDRAAAPVGIVIAILLLGYLLEVLGTLWPDAAFLQPYTPFHYLRPLTILGGNGDPADLAVLAALAVVAAAYGLWRFPRRDLAAPT